MRTILLTTYFLILCFIAYAQDDKAVKKADKYFEDKNFPAALATYEQALENNKEDPYVNFRIAQCYLITSPKTKALDFAHKAVKNSEKPSNEMYFALAQASHLNHQFDKAIEYYQKSDPGNTNKKAISKLINECNYGKKYVANPTAVKITNAGALVNTLQQEYLPYITADMSQLFFTSRRPGSTGGKIDADGLPYEDIYMSYNKGGAWAQATNIGAPLNTETHDACIGISENGQTMFIYRGTNGGDIYMSELKGKRWSSPESMPFNTTLFETSACLSPDERTLFFVRAGDFNSQRDIYMCSRTVGGNWSKPIKVPGINTEYDEDGPFLHPDGQTLYFSSKGHSSMGGYDVFKCTRSGSGWSTPVNMGYPINTAGDDVYFVLSADGKVGLYASDKVGGYGKQDIYSIRMPITEKAPELALLKGNVKDASTGKPIEAEITVTDNATNEIVGKYKSNSETGAYLVSLPSGKNYGIAIEQEGHLFHSENIFLSGKEGYKEVIKEIKLVNAKPGAKVVLRNIFFDSGKFEIRSESTNELQKLVRLLKENPSLRIEISGHTDNIGDPQINQSLSEQRAQEVLKFLVSQGIPTNRLQAKGFGSNQPIASNTTEEGRQQNRRTEFKVL